MNESAIQHLDITLRILHIMEMIAKQMILLENRIIKLEAKIK